MANSSLKGMPPPTGTCHHIDRLVNWSQSEVETTQQSFTGEHIYSLVDYGFVCMKRNQLVVCQDGKACCKLPSHSQVSSNSLTTIISIPDYIFLSYILISG
jgi:hypothetical protein